MGQGTIVAKNRDWIPNQVQRVRIVRPKTGNRYLGLFAEGHDEAGIKAGINDQALSVISASAGSLSKKLQDAQTGVSGVVSKILSLYSSVEDVLAHREIFAKARAEFLFLSDRHQIAVVEIGLDGAFTVTTHPAGTAFHTNHYCDVPMRGFNQTEGESSLTRYRRIQELLSAEKPPYTTASFKKMSADRDAGPDNSIWRTGSSPRKARTLATWIAEIPRAGAPTIYVKIANPDEAPKEYQFVIDDAFWQTSLSG